MRGSKASQSKQATRDRRLMSAFTGPLTLTQLDADWKLWRLEQKLSYEIGALGSGNLIEVPPGFVTDGATIPRLFWALLPTWGSYSRAAAVHDYTVTKILEGDPLPNAPDLLACDNIFWEATGVCNTPYLLRVLLYLGVRYYSMTR